MADENVYDSSTGGGYSNGTTSGQTAMDPLNAKPLDDLEFPTDAARQEEAEERYQPNPPLPEKMTDYPSVDGPFQRLVSEPHGNANEGAPRMKRANLDFNPDLGMSREEQQVVAQSAMNSTTDGTDDPNQEI